jgi:hypothetical protein
VTGRRREEVYIQTSFEAHASARGWLVYHTYDARRSAPGWPDAFCVRDGRAIAVELKTTTGRATRAQTRWIEELDQVPGITAFVAHCPRDWRRITDTLR